MPRPIIDLPFYHDLTRRLPVLRRKKTVIVSVGGCRRYLSVKNGSRFCFYGDVFLFLSAKRVLRASQHQFDVTSVA